MKFSNIELNAAEQLLTAIGVYERPRVRYDWWRFAPNIRNGRSKPSGPPKSFDSRKQRKRYAGQQARALYDHKRDGFDIPAPSIHAFTPHPSGEGATEFFGVRQQRRAFMRRQNKNLRSELKREKRKQKRAAS